ncbi:MAG TPA: DMT family transporter [Actinomycetota bacterium]|jgi:drug/metabolite transporter (DMT)-like permease|nr:DMT family transporter [Actinomycetota bacterium]
MTGVLWAAVAGVGFGVFQSVNRAAIEDLDVYRSTFIQLVVSAVILSAATAVSGDLTRLRTIPAMALVNFSLAGMIHFFVGWTLLNASQKRLGAARTSPLIAATPLFGAVVAAFALGEIPSAVTTFGIATIVVGVYVVGLGRDRRPADVAGGGLSAPTEVPALRHGLRGVPWKASSFGLGTAMCWAISPIFIRRGLEAFDAPLAGVTISMLAAVGVYGLAMLGRGRDATTSSASRTAMTWKLGAGVLVGLSTWTRWYAFSLAPVAVVLGLALLSVPTVMVLAPLLVGRDHERVTRRVVVGAGLVVAGALVLIVNP